MLVYMSNPGAQAFYSLMTNQVYREPKPIFELFTEMAVQRGAHGVIVGATTPAVISRVRELAGPELLILSPGVGAQGGDVKNALEAGSNYLIVGRSIYNSRDPRTAARDYRDATT